MAKPKGQVACLYTDEQCCPRSGRFSVCALHISMESVARCFNVNKSPKAHAAFFGGGERFAAHALTQRARYQFQIHKRFKRRAVALERASEPCRAPAWRRTLGDRTQVVRQLQHFAADGRKKHMLATCSKGAGGYTQQTPAGKKNALKILRQGLYLWGFALPLPRGTE